jgi:hypothetical protein
METVPATSVQAVCDELQSSFPSTETNPPEPLEGVFDESHEVAVIKRTGDRFRLRISGECFQYNDPIAIAKALESLRYAHFLTEHGSLVLGCVPSRNRSDLSILARQDDWYLRPWAN